MKNIEKPTASGISYSCYSDKVIEGENFVRSHVLSCLISGKQELFVGNKSYSFNEGDIRFFKKNQLAKFIKKPSAGGEFKTITIHLDDASLREISKEPGMLPVVPYYGEHTLLLKSSHLLKNFIESLSPYMDPDIVHSQMFTSLKVKEAVYVLLETMPGLKSLLFDFSEPHKIDLEAYMNEHYKFNIDLESIAYLTGRSLSTLKRDFQTLFGQSPSRWIQMRRLKEAYYLIHEKKLRPRDVYLDLGFVDFSHFSFAFKKAFGKAPTIS